MTTNIGKNAPKPECLCARFSPVNQRALLHPDAVITLGGFQGTWEDLQEQIDTIGGHAQDVAILNDQMFEVGDLRAVEICVPGTWVARNNVQPELTINSPFGAQTVTGTWSQGKCSSDDSDPSRCYRRYTYEVCYNSGAIYAPGDSCWRQKYRNMCGEQSGWGFLNYPLHPFYQGNICDWEVESCHVVNGNQPVTSHADWAALWNANDPYGNTWVEVPDTGTGVRCGTHICTTTTNPKALNYGRMTFRRNWRNYAVWAEPKISVTQVEEFQQVFIDGECKWKDANGELLDVRPENIIHCSISATEAASAAAAAYTRLPNCQTVAVCPPAEIVPQEGFCAIYNGQYVTLIELVDIANNQVVGEYWIDAITGDEVQITDPLLLEECDENAPVTETDQRCYVYVGKGCGDEFFGAVKTCVVSCFDNVVTQGGAQVGAYTQYFLDNAAVGPNGTPDFTNGEWVEICCKRKPGQLDPPLGESCDNPIFVQDCPPPPCPEPAYEIFCDGEAGTKYVEVTYASAICGTDGIYEADGYFANPQVLAAYKPTATPQICPDASIKASVCIVDECGERWSCATVITPAGGTVVETQTCVRYIDPDCGGAAGGGAVAGKRKAIAAVKGSVKSIKLTVATVNTQITSTISEDGVRPSPVGETCPCKERPCDTRECVVSYPDTAAKCLLVFETYDKLTGTVWSRRLKDGTDVDQLLEDCGIELEYVNDPCKGADATIQEPPCPAFQSNAEDTVFTRDVTFTRGDNQGQLVSPLWTEGAQVAFPLKAGANYLSDITHCMSIDQSCCLLALDQSLPITIRAQFDHEINPGNGSHTGFNINPGPGTIVASSPTNTTNTTGATIGGGEGVRAIRWVDIQYTLGDLLSREACWSTGALGTSNTLGEGPFPETYYETIYSMSSNISPDFLTQLTDILALCPCPNEAGRLSGLNAQAVGEKPGTPTDEALNATLVKRQLSDTGEVITADKIGMTGGDLDVVATTEATTARGKAVVRQLTIDEGKAVAKFAAKQVLSKAVAKTEDKKTESKEEVARR